MNLTFASLITPEGIAAAGALTTAIIALLKRVFPPIDARVSGAVLAFILTAVLYLAGIVAVGIPVADSVLTWITAWVACATVAVGVHSTVTHARDAGT